MSKVLIIQDCPKSQDRRLIPADYDPQFLDANQTYLAKYKASDLIIIDSSTQLEKKFLCQKLRRDGVGQPVIVFTDKESVNEKVEMLNHGADDVIPSKIHPEEFSARIRSLLRRPPVFFSEILRVDNLVVDQNKQEVKRGKLKIFLTKTEFKLLVTLIKNRGMAMSRDDIFEKVWGYESDQYVTIVDVYIRFLRKKIEEGFKKQLIQTVWGVGYRMMG